jgi:hypothetical protein
LNLIGSKDKGWVLEDLDGYDYRSALLIRLPSALWPPCFLPITSLWSCYGFILVFFYGGLINNFKCFGSENGNIYKAQIHLFLPALKYLAKMFLYIPLLFHLFCIAQ